MTELNKFYVWCYQKEYLSDRWVKKLEDQIIRYEEEKKLP